jgi:hypothetical protein
VQRLAELRVIFRNGDERRQPATPLFDAEEDEP